LKVKFILFWKKTTMLSRRHF